MSKFTVAILRLICFLLCYATVAVLYAMLCYGCYRHFKSFLICCVFDALLLREVNNYRCFFFKDHPAQCAMNVDIGFYWAMIGLFNNIKIWSSKMFKSNVGVDILWDFLSLLSSSANWVILVWISPFFIVTIPDC